MADPRRIYRFFLNLYPARFREEFSGPLERQLADDYRDALTGLQRILFWLRFVKDLAVSIPRELLRETARDVRYASRVYRRRWLVTLLAFTALALGIGATTGVFSVLNAVLLRSLPFREPERLVEVQGMGADGRAAFYRHLSASRYLSDAATFSIADMNLGISGDAVRVKVAETSAQFFQTLGVEPAFGRSFAADEDMEGRDAEAVISYGLWQQQLGGHPAVLGKTITLNGTPVTVIGVAPPSFDYPGKTAVWIPSAFDFQKVSKGGVIFWRMLGRLKPGIPLARANGMLLAEVAEYYPQALKRKSIPGFSSTAPSLVPLRDQLAGPVRRASWVLLAIVAFVLLIACANVAQLLLSRFAERRQELAIRAALGASRARLVQQLITESTLLTVSASLAGLVVARWAARLAAMAQPAQLASQNYTVLDVRVFGFALAVAALTGILFGVLPAFLMGRMQPSAGPMRTQTGAQGSGVQRMRSVLIAMQAAFTVVLVAGSFLTGRAFLHLLGTDLGFHTDHVITLNVSLAGTRYEANHIQAEYYRQALDRLRNIPGVESAAAAQFLPLVQNSYMGQEFSLDSAHKVPMTITLPVTPDYFRTLGTRIIEGREFTAADRAGAERVIVVSKTFAQQLGLGTHIVGRKLLDWQGTRQYTIVGVAADERLNGPSAPRHQQAYFPAEQWTPGFVTFVARVRGETAPYLAECRDAVRQVDPAIPVYDVKTLDRRLAENLGQPRFYATAILFLAGFALLLALIGVYGMAAYAIAQRRHEIGIRIAVGADLSKVRFMLVRQTLLPLILGVGAGIGGAFALANSLRTLIYGAPGPDLPTCGGAALLLTAATALAAWIATRRILKVDPICALRM
jgi:predicted permease